MHSLHRKPPSLFKTRLSHYTVLPIVVFVFIALGWYAVFRQANAIIETNITAYQQTELEIVRTAANGVREYVRNQSEEHNRTDIAEFEQEIFKKFIVPVRLLKNGDAWIYAPDYVVFDISADFPDEYRGKSMAEIFEIQKANGASHFEEMTAAVMEAREGVGWYVWLPEKGKEIAAWTPVRVNEYVWTIGLSTPLPEILEATGATEQIQMLNRTMGIGTIILLVMLSLWTLGEAKRWRIDMALRVSEAQYRQAVENSPNLIFSIDRRGIIRAWNQSCEKTFHYDQGVIGEHYRMLLPHVEDQLKVEAMLSSVWDRHSLSGIDMVYRCRNGEKIYTVSRIYPLYSPMGDVQGCVFANTNITGRRRAEDALQKAYAELETRVEERTVELKASNELLQKRINEINTLYQVSLNTTLSLHLDEVLEHTLDAINKTIKPDNIAILLIESETDELAIRAFSGFPGGPKLMRRALGVGIPGKVAQIGEAILLPDVRIDNDYQPCDSGTLSEVCVPLRLGKRIIGALNLESRKLNAFSKDDIRLLTIIARDLAIVIDNARLYEDTKKLKQFNENIVQGVTEAILMGNATGHFTFANPAAEKLLGYSRGELLGLLWTNIVPKYARKQIRHELAVCEEEQEKQFETVVQSKSGEIIPIIVSCKSSFNGKVFTGTLAVLTNIAERVQMEEELHKQATTDPLTGIFNRRYFFELAKKELKRTLRYHHPLSIIIFDIDFFKKINDAYGHAIGDETLCKLTEECQNRLRENDVFARYGGEGFIILLPETNLEQARQLAEHIRKKRAETVLNLGPVSVSLTISFGVASVENEKLSIDELLLRADKALYASKNTGRNRVTVWEK